jgi:hypothetical protein
MLRSQTLATLPDLCDPCASLSCARAASGMGPRNTRKGAKKLRDSHRGHRGNIKVVCTRAAPNFSLSLKIILRDLCVSQFPPFRRQRLEPSLTWNRWPSRTPEISEMEPAKHAKRREKFGRFTPRSRRSQRKYQSVRTPSAPNFSLSLKIILCDLCDLCVSLSFARVASGNGPAKHAKRREKIKRLTQRSRRSQRMILRERVKFGAGRVRTTLIFPL